MAKKPASVPAAESSSKSEAESTGKPSGVGSSEKPQSQVSSNRVYRVSIPRCLGGELLVEAESEQAAVDRYKAECGVNSSSRPAEVRLVEEPPKDAEIIRG